MINGAFGSGKTTLAELLSNELSNSMIFNPEEIGYMLRNLISVEDRDLNERTDDFQDIKLWKNITLQVARELKIKYKKDLIVPMTIHKSANFEYIYNGFKELDDSLYHFCLIASEETLKKRLTIRGDVIGGWQFQQIDKCIKAFKDNRFEEFIISDNLDTSEISDIILKKIKL
jgi:adenylate kinase family enzyme